MPGKDEKLRSDTPSQPPASNLNLNGMVPSFQLPLDQLGVRQGKNAWVNGTEPQNRVNENFAGLTRNGVFPVTRNEEATFVLNSALDGALTWLDADGDKNAFQQSLTSRGMDNQTLQRALLRSFGGPDSANLSAAQSVNFFRGAEIMRDTIASLPPGTSRSATIGAAKKNILFRMNQAGKPGVINFRAMDNKPITSPIANGFTILPLGVEDAKRIQQKVTGKNAPATVNNLSQPGTKNNNGQIPKTEKENKNSAGVQSPKINPSNRGPKIQ